MQFLGLEREGVQLMDLEGEGALAVGLESQGVQEPVLRFWSNLARVLLNFSKGSEAKNLSPDLDRGI